MGCPPAIRFPSSRAGQLAIKQVEEGEDSPVSWPSEPTEVEQSQFEQSLILQADSTLADPCSLETVPAPVWICGCAFPKRFHAVVAVDFSKAYVAQSSSLLYAV